MLINFSFLSVCEKLINQIIYLVLPVEQQIKLEWPKKTSWKNSCPFQNGLTSWELLLIQQSTNLQYELVLKNAANVKIIHITIIYQSENTKNQTKNPKKTKQTKKNSCISYTIMVYWLSLLYSFIQQKLNSGSTPAKNLQAACGRFAMARTSDNGPSWK